MSKVSGFNARIVDMYNRAEKREKAKAQRKKEQEEARKNENKKIEVEDR